MRVRIKKNFANYKEGQEFDWGDGMARVLAARGLIEEVRPAPPEIETADATDQPLERAVEQHRRKPKK